MAYSELDRHDAQIDQDEARMLAEEAPKKAPAVRTFCAHLDPDAEHPLYKKQCSGLCQHPSQHGRACFWNKHTAHDCLTYKRPFLG